MASKKVRVIVNGLRFLKHKSIIYIIKNYYSIAPHSNYDVPF